MAAKPKKLTNDDCCLMVGQFLQDWALMEARLNEAISSALELNPLQSAVLNSNLQMSNKVHIVRTAVNIIPIAETKRTKHDKALKKLADFLQVRNMVAHHAFIPSEDGTAVEFLVTKAKGKLVFPDTRWDAQYFKKQRAKIYEYYEALAAITKDINRAGVLSALARQSPISSKNALNLLGLPHPQPQENRSSDTRPSKTKTSPKTPPSLME